MRDLTGTAAANVHLWEEHNLDWFFIVYADDPDLGQSPQYFGSREVTIGGNLFQDLLADFSFGWQELNRRGGIAPRSDFRLSFRNEGGYARQLLNSYFLENDVVEAYVALSAPGEVLTMADLLPIARGVVEGYPRNAATWDVQVVDSSQRDWTRIPQRTIQPAAGNSFEFAPLENYGKPVPFPFGVLNIGPYDNQGKDRFLAPCRITDNQQGLTVTPGLYCGSYGTPFQSYRSSGLVAEILNYTQSGAYCAINTPDRRLLARPNRKETTNTVSDWYPLADGQTSTGIVVVDADKLHLFFAGVQKLGTLYQATIEINSTAPFDYSVALGTTTLASGSSTGDTSIALPIFSWAEDWDFEILLLKIDVTGTGQVNEASLELLYRDQVNTDTLQGIEFYQKVTGFADQVARYVDGNLITGVADTVLTNPVDQIQAVLRCKDLLAKSIAEINTASFTTARALRSDWNFSFSIFEFIENIEDLNPYLEEAGLHLFSNGAGQWTVIAREVDADTPQAVLLSGRNVCVVDPKKPTDQWVADLKLDRRKSREALTDFIAQGQWDRSADRYNALDAKSSAYRQTGTGDTSIATGQLEVLGSTFLADGVEPGWVVVLDGEGAFSVTVADDEHLNLTPMDAGLAIRDRIGVTFWLGQNLDPEVLRARRRHKTLETWGKKRDANTPTDIGGYESRFAGDQATLELMTAFQRDWYARLPAIVHCYGQVYDLRIDRGDIVVLDDPELEDRLRATQLTTLNGAITVSATEIEVAAGDIGLIRHEDILAIVPVDATSGNEKPFLAEIVQADADPDLEADTIPVLRAQLSTGAQAHPDTAAIRRFTSSWEVEAVLLPSLHDHRCGLRLVERPLSYKPVLTIAEESTPDWDWMSGVEQALYRAITGNDGLINSRDISSGAFIGEG